MNQQGYHIKTEEMRACQNQTVSQSYHFIFPHIKQFYWSPEEA